MALPDRIPVQGIASAEAAAYQAARREGETVTVIGDARRARLWIVSYQIFKEAGKVLLRNGETPTQTASDFQLIRREELAGALPDEGFVVSPDWSRLEDLLLEVVPDTRRHSGPVFPDAVSLGILATQDGTGGSCLTDPLPIYLHPAVATPPPFPKP